MSQTRSTRGTAPKASSRFTDEEKDAMKERARETRRRAKASPEEGDNDVRAKIAEMPEADRAIAERLHELIKASAPGISPRTWYGMPAYAKDGDTICFFQPAGKFKTRYGTLGFSDKAKLDEGELWPTSYAVQKLTPAVEDRIRALVARAAG